MKKKIKNWIKSWLEEPEEKWTPKKERALNAVAFSLESIIDSKNVTMKNLHCTEWVNGEGYNFSFEEFNQLTKKQRSKNFSLSLDELELLLACLNDLKYFDE